MSGEFDTDSDDRKISAKPSRQNNYIEDCDPESETDVEFKSERLSSADGKVEDDANSESETISEGESDQKPHLSNPSKKSSNSERVSSPERKLEHDSAYESVTSSELEPGQNLPLPYPSKPSSHCRQDLCPVEITAHIHSPNSSSYSYPMSKNNNATISNVKVIAHPGNSGVELQDHELMQPTSKPLQVPVLAPRKSISPGPRHTRRYSASSDILTTLERYLDDLDALSVQVPVGAHT